VNAAALPGDERYGRRMSITDKIGAASKRQEATQPTTS
jgi:hypothetical protein